MARDKEPVPPPPPSREGVISIIGPGMRVAGDCETEGTLRIEGIIEGAVRAGKAVVVGKDAVVKGDIITQDAVIGGHVNGSIVAESRLELQATCLVEGEVKARRIRLDEGGKLNAKVHMGEVTMPGGAAVKTPPATAPVKPAPAAAPVKHPPATAPVKTPAAAAHVKSPPPSTPVKSPATAAPAKSPPTGKPPAKPPLAPAT
jgi:cytoskeletal protein CcmA (bactofilin family)